jgi:segregation and condensation protein B
MNEHDLKYIIEATLLASGKPVTSQQLLELFDERERPTPELLTTALGLLAVDYENRGIELVEVASGWRIQVRPRAGEFVSRLWQERPSKYSRALLETLALVAYRQPITRSEIEEIRGVSISSTIMRTLQERNWIRTVGHREVPGRPELLGTTREFLDYFGLKSLDQLPTLAELKDVETIGVQLELPSDQAPTTTDEGSEAAAATTEETVASSEDQAAAGEDEESDENGQNDAGEEAEEASAEASDGTNDDSELSADADDGDEDSDVSPTMVASEDDGEHNPISEPPREQ